ncbi:hypothetical protein BH10PLA2_BH10PLA2_11960 [soil metagenome]
MTKPHSPKPPGPTSLDIQLDRLVDGELSDNERIDVLRSLESEHDGWRRCALAFLEAQSWRQALSATESESSLVENLGRRRSIRFWRPVVGIAGLAAGMLLTFMLGWSLRDSSASIHNDELAMSSTENQETSPPKIAQGGAIMEGNPLPAAPNAIEPAVKRWQKQGYQAETASRIASVQMKDGRRVQIPVQEVRLKYVGNRTY